MKTSGLFIHRFVGILVCSIFLLPGCSSDKSETELDEKTQLILTASSVEVKKGDEVTFVTTANGEVIEANIYIEGTKIESANHTFEDVGEYEVVAKREGYTDSEKTVVKVSNDSEIDKKQLLLIASSLEVEKGDEVTFVATANGEAVEADIYIAGTKIESVNHTFEDVGEYEVVAKKEGYTDSEKTIIKAYKIVVYVAGFEREDRIDIAKYWENDKVIALTGGYVNAQANSIFVADGDVYVAGHDGGRAQYWKNGAAMNTIDFNTIRGEAYAVFVDNKDVYVAGWEYDDRGVRIAHYWKNGQAFAIGAGNKADVVALSIFVDNGDVYVSGYKHSDKDSRSIAQYWKNGVAVTLTDGNNDAFGTSIFVDNGDVYVAGYEYNGSFIDGTAVAKYWKNGAAVSLSDGSKSVIANSIFVDNGDVYVAARGYEGYWKNDVPVPFSFSERGTPFSIFVDNKNVYVSGLTYSGGQERVAYWKNGERILLSPGSQYAVGKSIFISRSLTE